MAAIVPNHHWQITSPSPDAVEPLAAAAQVPPLIAQLLYQRGCRTPEAIDEFLNPSASRLHRPETLPDIARATERIIAALEKKEPILVYGDYDVDGVCGTALLVSALKNLGGEVRAYLPHRASEGYGVSFAGIEFARNHNIRLIITNDCGSSDIEALNLARAAKIDVIVTDHHEIGPQPPPVLAFVNPKRPDSRYPFRELAGSGVAFKLAWHLLSTLGRSKEELIALLDLAGLGTIADVVPLIGENRLIARLGLIALNQTTRPGIRMLIESSRLKSKVLTARDIGFVLAPRINAAGRVGHARTALELLLTEDETRARTIARELEILNRTRQALEDQIINEASTFIEAEKMAENRVLVLAQPGWNEGVIGIVAARLVERFWRPCIMIALKKEIGKGSGRSVTGFNLYEALHHCSEHLVAYGGHRYAAGLKILPERVPDLRTALNRFAAELPEEIFQPTLHIEAVASLNEVDENLLSLLARFEPFGPENPEPVFASLGLEVVGYPRRVGRDKAHLKFRVRSGNKVLDAIAWQRSDELLNLEIGKPGHLDICYTVTRDSYAGRTKVQLNIIDLRTK
ncbi:MAG: single-stranded-DNA-specific exonuclease RecJ [candidate division WOR-3 bacterium]|nr:single-stranded-DNA-specific exonuclease RecJ [candidate division WOR-3 bacterium]MCR4423782.1 single-stranded-DNA-specific exonuclease RecJ [candidate division WOR-3 bacterium]MDH7519121.1 single-stranded-DNA-specific exonuclease RecJ [bacterium]